MSAQHWSAGLLVGILGVAFIAGNASWSAPPRFDGAGYAVLARALLEHRGYRAIDQPDERRHGHFPPGYPILLAGTWKLTGISVRAAHVLSVVCTVGAVVISWLWFRRFMAPGAAFILGLALAVNWLWARTGSAFLSEPPYMLLCQLTVLVASGGMGRNRATRCVPAKTEERGIVAVRPAELCRTGAVGVLLAGCVLTRHIAIGLVLAVLLDRAIARRWDELVAITVAMSLLVLPWVIWLAVVGSESGTQAGMIFTANDRWFDRIGRQLFFYFMRIPDQLTGPVVEIGTITLSSTLVRRMASVWGFLATAVVIVGLIVQLLRPRMRVIGLILVVTILILLPWPFTEAGRFLIPLIPCILLAGVEGLAWLLIAVRRRGGKRLRPSKAHSITASVLLAASLPYSVYATIARRAESAAVDHRNFDSACDWLVHHGDRAGAILSRHPGEVFWQTGRQGLAVSTLERRADHDADAESIARTIARHRVAYLLIDQARYAEAPQSPLARFVAERSAVVRKVWQSGEVMIYEVLPLWRGRKGGQWSTLIEFRKDDETRYRSHCDCNELLRKSLGAANEFVNFYTNSSSVL